VPEASAPGGAVESLLRRDGLIVAGALSVLFLFAGLYTVMGLGMDMSAIEMTRMAGPFAEPMAMAMQPQWSAAYALLVFLMWWVMMIAMMTPSAAPLVLLFVAVKRTGPEADSAALQSGLLLTGYLGVWAGFSALATLAQWAAENAGIVSGAMMTIESRSFAALVLIAAGLYQFTPVKSACLRHCRAPGQFLAEHRRPGTAGALRMGIAHGTYCLGCCWALMALLFVGGIMNLIWIAGLTAYVLVEKLLPWGDLVAKIAGAGLAVLGCWLLVT
jgi:predicted metal-binding membrane protein